VRSRSRRSGERVARGMTAAGYGGCHKIGNMTSRIGEIIIDCPDPEAAATFWCAALGYREFDRDETGVAIAGDSRAPTILLIRSDEPKRAKTPIHFDLCPTDRDQAAEVERLVAL